MPETRVFLLIEFPQGEARGKTIVGTLKFYSQERSILHFQG